MLQMLDAGGMPVLHDEERAPDIHNPRGYFEYSPVKALRRDASWVPGAQGQAVKVIFALLSALPVGVAYRVILMRRDVGEVVASQSSMLGGAEPDAPAPERLAEILSDQLEEAVAWIRGRPEFRLLEVAHRDAVEKPRDVAVAVAGFLERDLDIDAMAAVVEASLHRSRRDGGG